MYKPAMPQGFAAETRISKHSVTSEIRVSQLCLIATSVCSV